MQPGSPTHLTSGTGSGNELVAATNSVVFFGRPGRERSAKQGRAGQARGGFEGVQNIFVLRQ